MSKAVSCLRVKPGVGVVTLGLLATAVSAVAQTEDANAERVVITGSPVARALADAPYAASVVGREALRSGGPMVNLSEALSSVPGLVVANRSNYAQDLQISSRGFGSRAGFGVRGVRLYSDGIPASGPDGQGQVSHFDLAGAQRVEVLRGPFSVLYGNSSGGVIASFSAAPKKPELEAAADIAQGGFNQWRVSAATPLGQAEQGMGLRLSLASMQSDGFRPQSAAERRAANARFSWEGGAHSVVALLSHLNQPAQDPLGLSRAQWDADPLSTTSVATQFNTRKTTQQNQGGLRWRMRPGGEGALRETSVAVYSGARAVQQFLAITPATQANVRHGGAVVDFNRSYSGTEARVRLGWSLAGNQQLDWVLGASADRQTDERRGYENFVGTGAAQVVGVLGNLRRNENNSAKSTDLFSQVEWAPSTATTATFGLRAGKVNLSTQDAYLSNGDDSGSRSFSYTNPVLGLRFAPIKGLNLYGSVARGYETPTLGELAYRRDGTGGFNLDLQPQSSTQAELGAKWQAGAAQAELALFQAKVKDEISVATNSGGRSAFQNVGRTTRKGAELSGRYALGAGLRIAASATWLNARYGDEFLVCAAIPCTTPTLVVAAGNRIAGTQGRAGSLELAWQGAIAGVSVGDWALEARGVASTAANDRNTEMAPGYGLVNLRWAYTTPLPAGHASGWRMQWLVRLDNAADRRMVGSVIVNDANARFYEPGAPRTLSLSLRLLMP